MVVELLGIVVGIAFAWLFVYSAALFGAKHALRDHFADQSAERSPAEDEEVGSG